MIVRYLFALAAGLSILATVSASEPRLDHVIVAVNDIQAATQTFRRSGFVIKKGKPHGNGLQNAFVEFTDGTELELMSVQHQSDDPLTLLYSRFLANSEGGVFVALSGFNLTRTSARLAASGIEHSLIIGGLWNQISFPEGSGSEHIFLIEYPRSETHQQTLTDHDNGVTGIDEVWLDSTDAVVEVLRVLGVPLENGSGIHRLGNATLRLAHQNQPAKRPAVQGLVFSLDIEAHLDTIEAYGIWLTAAAQSVETGDQ